MNLYDPHYPPRAETLRALERVYTGEHYDHIEHDFSEEGKDTGDYIPLARRRPSVRTNLCSVVVEDSVSLLFSDDHFPQIVVDDQASGDALRHLVKETELNLVMTTAALRGSVGSIAILFRVLSFRPFFTVMPTAFLTPQWQPQNPKALLNVTEKYKVKAQALIDQGYKINPDDGDHWFMRQWTETEEVWFTPWPVSKPGAGPRRDDSRTVGHGLGFVPIVWIKNLPGSDDSPDGACTFLRGIDIVIEIDYLLSQGGRGLKYAADPTLVLKSNDNSDGKPARVGGASTALNVPSDGDAKLLEIRGQASGAVLEQARELRAIALEAMHGNRANADKMTVAQSGRAMEMMNRGLIGLAAALRVSYGSGALMQLIRMVCDASKRIPGGILINGRKVADINPDGLLLRWPAWYPPTHEDRQAEAESLTTALNAGIISRETAVRMIAPTCDIEDVTKELTAIEENMAEQEAREIRVAAAVQVKESGPA